MNIVSKFQQHEIPGRISTVNGNGNLPKIVVSTKSSSAEIYLHGAHLTHFQKNGEPPLIFMSRKSHFKNGEPIRGGVPVIFPWFGPRADDMAHGFARITEWELIKTSAAPDGSVILHFRLPEIPERPAWKNLRAEFIVTISSKLTMELAVTNLSSANIAFENCLHTYFQVGGIGDVSICGLENSPFDDFAAGANGARRAAENLALRIGRETNRVYFDSPHAVEIHDEKFRRTIRVEKSNSNSTVVWNPWTTQKLPDDFDPAEHAQMVCVESGNVKQNKITLAPNQTSALKVILSSRPI